MIPTRYVAATLIVAGLAGQVQAERKIEIVTRSERSLENKLLLAGLVGGGVLAGGLGVYFHLESRDASNAVAADTFTSEAWSTADQANVDRADDNRRKAALAYGIGGAFVVASIVTLIVTEPKAETIVITPNRPTPIVTPAEGGAMLGGRWSF
ncbi:MAG: hypothetical protein SFX73_36520 [Kofleriaceae bacterium]|nr:hypothetical protein [Kofleriaceae bacterium]